MSSTPRGNTSASVWPLVMCIAVIAVAGAALVLTVPHLFMNADPRLRGLVGALAILVAGFAVLGRRLRLTSESDS